jgi:F-type H+-transporting ATPase subunit b
MSFDWSTFSLEALNFLVLVWLLKRFLYQPVLAVIERRRAEGERVTASAKALRDEARELKAQYEAKLAHAADDRERALAQLDEEISTERAKRLARVDADMAAERQRRSDLEARQSDRREAERDRQAVALGARFASRMLERLAGPGLEDRLVELAVADLKAIQADQRDALQAALVDADAGVQIATAYALEPQRRAVLAKALGELAGRKVSPEFSEDQSLVAGVRIRVGSWVLMANLRDELRFFAERFDHGG